MSKDGPTAIAVPSATSTRDTQISERDLPKMTVGTSEEYIEKMASALSHAMLPNEIWRIVSKEGVDGISSDASEKELLHAHRSLVKQFLLDGAKSGAFIAEAGDFSACASWWPPGSHEPPKDLEVDGLKRQGETLRTALARATEKIKAEQIWSRYGQEFWHLGLIGRDPRKPVLSGAVRALLQPFIDQAATEGKPIWLETTSEHARDIYLHFGWQVVKTVTFHGHNIWCMILHPPSQGNAC